MLTSLKVVLPPDIQFDFNCLSKLACSFTNFDKLIACMLTRILEDGTIFILVYFIIPWYIMSFFHGIHISGCRKNLPSPAFNLTLKHRSCKIILFVVLTLWPPCFRLDQQFFPNDGGKKFYETQDSVIRSNLRGFPLKHTF